MKCTLVTTQYVVIATLTYGSLSDNIIPEVKFAKGCNDERTGMVRKRKSTWS